VVWSTVRSFRLRDADAHDAVQNTWLRMIEQLGTVRDAERLPGWLATTARRECLKIVRDSRREVAGLEPTVFERADEGSLSPERIVIDRTMNTLLWERVAELPRPARHMLVTLTGPDAPRYDEFARSSGLPIGSIGPKRMRYLRELRRRLEGSGLGVQAWQ
jgi:RNA polymerase sigma factor (sigma-70 family)